MILRNVIFIVLIGVAYYFLAAKLDLPLDEDDSADITCRVVGVYDGDTATCLINKILR